MDDLSNNSDELLRLRQCGGFGTHLIRPLLKTEVDLLGLLKRERVKCLLSGSYRLAEQVEEMMAAGLITEIEAIGIMRFGKDR